MAKEKITGKLIRRLTILAAALLIGIIIFPASVQARPYIGSPAYCLMDFESGQLLLGKNIYEARPVASTTKVMTAVLALEYTNDDEIATVSARAAKTPESCIGLREGQKIKIEDLLKAALIRSGNDASVVLAEYIAGSEDIFAHLMNKKAYLLGAVNTNFRNASGLPHPEHNSSCYDLAVITRYALKNPQFARLVATRETTMNHPGYPAGKTINNTNRLLQSYPGATGVKTGTTNAAGNCLIASARRDDRTLISVVLRSPDRYGDSTRLLNYGYQSLTRERVVEKNQYFKQIRVAGGKKMTVEVYPEKDVYLWLPEHQKEVEKVVKLDYRPQAPLEEGEKLGVLEIRYLGAPVERVNLITRQAVEKEPTGVWRLWYRFYLQVQKEFREK